ncbi:MAG: DUF4167 domain-containing protein [Henriciella sp.]|nr:DUF4167 domain-containing protein [Hyphomonadaceae bacterium]
MAMQRKRRRRSGGNNNNNPNPNRHYESNGPDVRIRGSAQQILDKYLQYARDAQTSGDRVKAEALFQHAEHYARIVAVFEKQKEEARLEREARDAARAEERAQREAERAAQSEDDENASSDDANSEETTEASTDDPSTETKPRRRGRKPREESGSDELKVIDGDDSTDSASEDTAEKPKRRRTYSRKKDAPVDAVEEADGVMKTLARGADEVVAEAE